MQAANKKALITITVPASKSELATIIAQHFLADFLNIVPTIWHINGQKFPRNVWAVRINNRNVVGKNGGFHV